MRGDLPESSQLERELRRLAVASFACPVAAWLLLLLCTLFPPVACIQLILVLAGLQCGILALVIGRGRGGAVVVVYALLGVLLSGGTLVLLVVLLQFFASFGGGWGVG
jgi:hypothetical protein